MKHFLLLLFIAITHISISQCTLKLSGQVIDLDDGNELADCAITLLPSNSVVTTNNHGQFIFNNLCSAEYTLVVQHLGCRDTLVKIILTKSLFVKIKLPHSAFELKEVDVMDKRIEMKQTQTVDMLDAKELKKVTGLSLAETLKNISGVTTLNTGATISKPMLHGMQGYRLLILNNGIRHEGQQWGNEHAPEIDPFIAKKVTVIKGVNSIRYGSDAIAGVVLVEPNELPDTAGINGEFNFAGFSNGKSGAGSIMLEGAFEKLKGFNWRVQSSLKKSGNIKTPEYFINNTGVNESNFSVALGYHYKSFGIETYYSQFNSEIGIYSGSHIGNLTDLQLAYLRSKPADSLTNFTYAIERPKQSVSHELFKTEMHYHFGARWRAKVQYAYQFNWRREFDLHLPKSEEKKALLENIPQVDYRITSQTADVLLEHDNIRSFRGMYGISAMNQKNVYLGRFFIPFYESNSIGGFVTERYVKQHYEIEAGVRYDYKELQSFFYKSNNLVTPQLYFSNFTFNSGYIWKPDTTFNLFVNAGSAWRAPAVNELYANGIHHGVSSIERGNENFKTERAYNITASGIVKKKRIHAELTGYYYHINNYIFLNPSGKNELTIRGAFPVFEYQQNNARITGADLKVTLMANNYFDLGAKGMLVRGWNIDLNDHLVLMPADRLEMFLRLKVNSLKKLEGMYFQINNLVVDKQYRIPLNSDFIPPPKGYYLLGFELGTGIKIAKQTVNVSVSASNLLNKKYRDYLDRFRYFIDSPGQSFNFRLSIPFSLINKNIKNNNHEKK